MTKPTGERIAWAVVAAAILIVSLLFGVNYPIPAPPATPAPMPAAAAGGPRERIAIDAGVDSYVYNGADMIFYSNDHSTSTASIAGDSGTVTGATVAATSNLTTPKLTASGTITGNALVAVGNATVATLTVGSTVFAVSSPITISGVLSNVRVLYYQVP